MLKQSPLRRLSTIVICGVLRLGSRLVVSDFPLETRFPILLPNRSHITFLIVKLYHVKEGHAGAMHTLASVRKRFWVLKGVSCVRRVIEECRVSRTALLNLDFKLCHRCLGIESRLAGQLLRVGVDFAGGFMTKSGRKHTKRYLRVFTCMAVCAVHLEVIFGLDTDSFLLFLSFFFKKKQDKHKLDLNKDIFNTINTNLNLCTWYINTNLNPLYR